MKQLSKMLTLSHVPRWAIIDVTKQQNVGEHSYRVMVIALTIAEFIEGMGTNVDTGALLKEAVLHDIEESETGDIPTPFKRKAGLSTPTPATLEGYIISLADLIEAYIFLTRYGVRSQRIEREIRDKIDHKMSCFDWGNESNIVMFIRYIDEIITTGCNYE